MAGAEVLRGLAAEPRILAACLYPEHGRVLACYARDPGAAAVFPKTVGIVGIQARNGDLLLSRPIVEQGQRLGAMWIRFDSQVSLETLRHDVAMVSLAMAVCFIIAVLLSSKLQAAISGPVQRLAETARAVSVGRNYSLRAEKAGNDEVGRLVDSFNEMLAQLGEHAAELHALYDSALHAIVTVMADGTITAWNRGAEHMFGFPEPAAAGQPFGYFLAEASRDVYTTELHRVRAASGERSEGKLVELAGLRRDGAEFPMGATFTQWSSNKGTFYTIFMRDATERQLLEVQLAQAQKLESIGQLAAGVAHEINTPIQYVGDNTRFLEESFRYLDKVLASYDGLTRAVESAGLLSHEVQQVHEAAEEADLEYLHDEIPRAIRQSGEGVERVATIVKAMKEFPHFGMTGEHRADFAQLDAMSPEFHLVVQAAQKLEVPVGPLADAVASAEKTRAAGTAEWIRQEPLRGQFRMVQVAQRNALAADVKFTGNAWRHRPLLLIHYIELRVCQRAANRNNVVFRTHEVSGGPHGGFGRPIRVPQCLSLAPEALRQFARKDLTSGNGGEMARALPSGIEKKLPGGRSSLHHCSTGGSNLVSQLRPVPA